MLCVWCTSVFRIADEADNCGDQLHQQCHLLDAVVDIPILFSMHRAKEWSECAVGRARQRRRKEAQHGNKREEHKKSIAIVIIARGGTGNVLKVRVIFQLARFTSTLWRISGISGRHNTLVVEGFQQQPEHASNQDPTLFRLDSGQLTATEYRGAMGKWLEWVVMVSVHRPCSKARGASPLLSAKNANASGCMVVDGLDCRDRALCNCQIDARLFVGLCAANARVNCTFSSVIPLIE